MTVGHGFADNRLVHELYSAQFWAIIIAGCPFQFQHYDGVWGRCHQDMLWHEQGHLGASLWPIATQVKAVNPHLTLERKKEKEKPSTPAALPLMNRRAGMHMGQPAAAEAGNAP